MKTFKKNNDLQTFFIVLFHRCMSRQIPMLVSNPDFSRPGSGCAMPGIIGNLIHYLNDDVHYLSYINFRMLSIKFRLMIHYI